MSFGRMRARAMRRVSQSVSRQTFNLDGGQIAIESYLGDKEEQTGGYRWLENL